MPGCSPRLGSIALGVLLAATVPAQHERWIADLGDPQLGEAAERALLEFGDKACQALQPLIETWDASTPRSVERLRAALRVIDLLGEPAAPLAEPLVKHLAGLPPELRLPVFTALGSLAPYASVDAKQIPYDELMAGIDHGEQQLLFTAFVRLAVRAQAKQRPLDLANLAKLPQFTREVALERVVRSGAADVDVLRTLLLDRKRFAWATDVIRYNGVDVPAEDGFRLRTAQALVELAPDDTRSIVGHGCVARLHPHRATRRASLQALARLGPGLDEALPDLVHIAQLGEPEDAAEALKLLLLLDRAVGPWLAEIKTLEAHSDGRVRKLAAGLATRLQEMGFVAQPLPKPEAPPSDSPDPTELVVASLQANPQQNLTAHVESFYRSGHALPDDLVTRIAELGRSRSQDERDRLSRLLASFGEGWYAKVLGRSVSGGNLNVANARAYGVIVVGEPTSAQELVLLLDHDNVAVRLAAARQLAAQHERLPAAPGTDASLADEWQQRLMLAARADAPASSKFKSTNGWFTMRLDLQTELQAAAAAALTGFTVPTDLHAGLLRKVLRHDDATLVALAVERWSAAAPRELLAQIAQDPRPEVGKAGAAALAKPR